MWIEIIGVVCCGWTLFEVLRLVTRAGRTRKVDRATATGFGAWDREGDAIDVEIVD